MMRRILLIMSALAAIAGTAILAQTITTRVRLVEVTATVFDGKGRAIDGIPQSGFQILDNGAPQPIFSFESVSGDLTCAILLDTTASMRDALGGVKNGVSGLLDNMAARDTVAIYSFSVAVERLQDFTTDKEAAKRAVLRTRASGSTALFDSIVQVADEISQRPGKKAIVLFTDGADNASRLIADSASRRVLKAGVTLYAVAEGDALNESKLLQQLHTLAEKTGGICYRAHSPKEMGRVFENIQSDLKHMYLFSYKPPSETDETKWRTIQVVVNGFPDYKVRGKQGYFPN
jgi:VWFA-related protein